MVVGGSHTAYRNGRGLLIISLLALWSLVYDGVVLQGHHHPPHATAFHTGAQAPSVSATLAEDDCALCEAAATAEPYLPPTTVAVVAPLAESPVVGSTPAPYPAPLSRAHIWQSRAPPEPVPHP